VAAHWEQETAMTARLANLNRLALAALAGLGLSCGGEGSSPTAPDSGGNANADCTTLGQCTFVRDALQAYYYWYKELPNPDPGSFASPEAYLEAVRYRALDSSFSYVTSKASSDAFYSDSQFIGYGLSYKRTADTVLRLAQTFPGSPASDAGMDRGDVLLTVNGKAVADLLRTGEIETIFGAEQVGVLADLSWRDMQGRDHAATLAKRLVTIPTVSQVAVLGSGGTRVGYLHFRNFVEPSVEALNTAFTQLRDQGATELVLDLRYNGGGLVSVAQHLAGLIAGPPLVGRVFVQFTHNDKQSSRNTSYKFEAKPQALVATRLVVITTGGSASASEAIVNGLRPYMDVKVVGDTTYGKPVGQYGFDFCQKVLYPVAFLVTNADGEADYFDGIPADCAAEDDVDHALASPQEASLAEALYVVRNGHCSGASSARAEIQARSRARERELRRGGWRDLLNAW
jgi:carboxyl-terminal processing protease